MTSKTSKKWKRLIGTVTLLVEFIGG